MPASRSEPSGGRSFPLRARLLATAVAAAALVLVLVLGLRQARPTERAFHAPLVAAPSPTPRSSASRSSTWARCLTR